jgi:hypothetical protein
MMMLLEERRVDRTYRTQNKAERLFQPVPDFRNKPLHSGIRHRGITSKSSGLSFRNSGLAIVNAHTLETVGRFAVHEANALEFARVEPLGIVDYPPITLPL